MYVEIQAHDTDNDSRGKTTWLNTGSETPKLRLIKSRAEHLGSPDWHIAIKATSTRSSGTGERGGIEKVISYDLEINLTPTDLEAIVNFVLSNDLITVKPKARRKLASK